MSSTPASLTVSLLGHSTNSANLGLGALTAAEVSILRDISAEIGVPIKIRVLDWKQAEPHYISGPDIEIVELTRDDVLSPKGLFAHLRRSDLIIDIGAGDSFADIYGSGRLKRMFLFKYLGHLAGTPFVLAPQTIGPFNPGWSLNAALLHMRLCKAVFSRDDLSTTAARAMGYKGKLDTASDVALLLPYDQPRQRTPDAPVRVGLNISGLLMHGGYNNAKLDLKTDYPALVDRLVSHFSELENTELHIVGHVLSKSIEVEDDYRAGEKVAAAHPKAILAPRFAGPVEAKSYIAGMDFFMGARMHATIAAFSSGVPVVPMAYSRKFSGLFGSLGYDRTVDCTSESNETIEETIKAAFVDRDTLRAEVAVACDLGRERLAIYTGRLTTLLQERARKRGLVKG